MPLPLFGLVGGMAAIRAGHSLAKTFGSNFLKGPLIQGGQFGVGYTGGSYFGYGAYCATKDGTVVMGITSQGNSVDPLMVLIALTR